MARAQPQEQLPELRRLFGKSDSIAKDMGLDPDRANQAAC